MLTENKYIRFDWAVKRMLRDKANFAVLEGLITVLLGEKIIITELLESEGNQNSGDDKFNRVDIKAKNSKGEIIIVEVQLTRQLYYLQRMLYGVSKAITEHIQIGNKYDQVKKVYSINILYFDLGQGSDYLYHGKTIFTGVHTGDQLKVNTKEANEIRMTVPENVFPEYYIIRVNEFNDVATTPIEEWLDYLKNNHIKENTSTPGLQEARKKLLYMTMSDSDRRAYDAHMDDIMVQNDVLDTAKMEGRAEGLEEGRAEGRAEGLEEGRAAGLEEGRAEGRAEGLEEGVQKKALEVAKNLKSMGLSIQDIQRVTGLSKDVIESL
ncbi:MAG: Rpn family recombination-promoting nuclease/putative transposase [Bacteroidales bacterium]|nr:Rpn family recombination-promoting nuclease/putative transposase [Bacteroidales bacterium]MDD6538874.1 Rpn family recombination-promoting nuclease/putative transposase [Bacteroidales bacterium]MDD6775037.1 Rpn family recombination-promoting nuclease/putative transposase [Bacteroidales bacterium]